MDFTGGLFWLAVVSIVFAIICSYYWDKYRWNNGINRDNGEKWELVSVDNNEDRLYTTRKGGYCTISWRVDK
jgi:hypothetical protein